MPAWMFPHAIFDIRCRAFADALRFIAVILRYRLSRACQRIFDDYMLIDILRASQP